MHVSIVIDTIPSVGGGLTNQQQSLIQTSHHTVKEHGVLPDSTLTELMAATGLSPQVTSKEYIHSVTGVGVAKPKEVLFTKRNILLTSTVKLHYSRKIQNSRTV